MYDFIFLNLQSVAFHLPSVLLSKVSAYQYYVGFIKFHDAKRVEDVSTSSILEIYIPVDVMRM